MLNKLIQDIMLSFFIAKNGEDPIKDEGATVLKLINTNSSNTQGQLIPHSEVESSQNSNSS